MDGWFCVSQESLPRGIQRTERLSSLSFFALLRARRKSLFFLTKLIMDGRVVG
jgi:hypothetical protein